VAKEDVLDKPVNQELQVLWENKVQLVTEVVLVLLVKLDFMV
jgi:hypothetical protein